MTEMAGFSGVIAFPYTTALASGAGVIKVFSVTAVGVSTLMVNFAYSINSFDSFDSVISSDFANLVDSIYFTDFADLDSDFNFSYCEDLDSTVSVF